MVHTILHLSQMQIIENSKSRRTQTVASLYVNFVFYLSTYAALLLFSIDSWSRALYSRKHECIPFTMVIFVELTNWMHVKNLISRCNCSLTHKNPSPAFHTVAALPRAIVGWGVGALSPSSGFDTRSAGCGSSLRNQASSNHLHAITLRPPLSTPPPRFICAAPAGLTAQQFPGRAGGKYISLIKGIWWLFYMLSLHSCVPPPLPSTLVSHSPIPCMSLPTLYLLLFLLNHPCMS